MGEPTKGNVEQVLGSAISVPMTIIISLADLLIAKQVISRDEMASLLQRLAESAPSHGANEGMVRILLEGTLTRYQTPPESGH
ncbi:hypothetical protein CWS35_10170 [Bradyrhizobium sp. SK17]|nr:hypothetical protein CWS35_10170 [Bradyrhizobium sp. SK17]